jgi:O-antigen biosynthesis protein
MILDSIENVAANPRQFEPTYVPVTSAWIGHGAFAIWLVKNTAPRVVVELGSHYGYSYFAMCQAVAQNNLQTKCFAVDTWQGDEHAGFYDDSVYNTVVAQNAHYAQFSTLLRKRFDQALVDIPDGSVDLLHVDGRHFYEDVKEDFESYIPKLSSRAIVLFHDVEVTRRNFGVKQYFAELMQKYEGFHFVHAHGLGVMFFGAQQGDFARALAEFTKSDANLAQIRSVFRNAPVPVLLSKTLRGRIVRKLGRLKVRLFGRAA